MFWTGINQDGNFFNLNIYINWNKQLAGVDVKLYLMSKSQNTQIGTSSSLEGLKKENENRFNGGNAKRLNWYSLFWMDLKRRLIHAWGLDLWEQDLWANWTKLKTLPRVYHNMEQAPTLYALQCVLLVQIDPRACSWKKNPPVYWPLNCGLRLTFLTQLWLLHFYKVTTFF